MPDKYTLKSLPKQKYFFIKPNNWEKTCNFTPANSRQADFFSMSEWL